MTSDEILSEGPSGYTVSKPSMDLEITNNYKPLSSKEAHTHLLSLENMLTKLSRFMYDNINDKELRNNAAMQHYMIRLGDTLNAVVLKNESQSIGDNADVQQNIVIDPSSSGFPLFARDITLLYNDQQEADKRLAAIPNNSELVEAAINSSFHKVFPNKQIQQMLEHNYYSKLKEVDLPRPLEVYDSVFVKETKTGVIYKRSIEKLDDSYNLPRFYTIYFEVPKLSTSNGTLSEELKNCIVNDGLQTVVSHELPYLTNRLEAIDGIQMQLVQRFDLGPFYNVFTENSEEIKAILEGALPTDGIISFTKNYVTRVSEVPVTGFKNKWKASFSGDAAIGVFSDVLSKTYMIMPNKLVQKAVKQGINLGNIELIGITKEGDFS